VIVTNVALLVAVHAQPVAAVTPTVPLPPSGPNVVVGWAMLNEQDGAVGVAAGVLSLPHAAAAIARARDTDASAAKGARRRTIIGNSTPQRIHRCRSTPFARNR
jgi:hypothetical protein